MIELPKLAWAAAILAFLSAASEAFSAFTTEPILLLPVAVIPLGAAIGILRGRVWSAWGMALYICAELVWGPVLLARSRSDAAFKNDLIAALVLATAMAILFFLAGRSLARAGAPRGHAYPWLILAALAALPLFFVQAFSNPTGSMEETMLVGDKFLVRTFPRVTPARGDIIVFAYPVDHNQTFTKRIVGMPGDRLRFVHKVLYRNGVRLDEPYAAHKLDYEDSYRDNFPTTPNVPVYPQAQEMLSKNVEDGEVVVPPGRYFVLGDNRDQSLDSRYWGFVRDSEVIGEPFLIYDSKVETPNEIGKAPNAFHPPPTRWNRIFKRL